MVRNIDLWVVPWVINVVMSCGKLDSQKIFVIVGWVIILTLNEWQSNKLTGQ